VLDPDTDRQRLELRSLESLCISLDRKAGRTATKASIAGVAAGMIRSRRTLLDHRAVSPSTVPRAAGEPSLKREEPKFPTAPLLLHRKKLHLLAKVAAFTHNFDST
jgi:hypothetical protein